MSTSMFKSLNTYFRSLFMAKFSHFGTSSGAVVATISAVMFFLFSQPRPFLIGVLRSKNLFSNSLSERTLTLDSTSFQTPSAILDFAGGSLFLIEGLLG